MAPKTALTPAEEKEKRMRAAAKAAATRAANKAAGIPPKRTKKASEPEPEPEDADGGEEEPKPLSEKDKKALRVLIRAAVKSGDEEALSMFEEEGFIARGKDGWVMFGLGEEGEPVEPPAPKAPPKKAAAKPKPVEKEPEEDEDEDVEEEAPPKPKAAPKPRAKKAPAEPEFKPQDVPIDNMNHDFKDEVDEKDSKPAPKQRVSKKEQAIAAAQEELMLKLGNASPAPTPVATAAPAAAPAAAAAPFGSGMSRSSD